jgi:TM2 domain-containing membrane protein YozV
MDDNMQPNVPSNLTPSPLPTMPFPSQQQNTEYGNKSYIIAWLLSLFLGVFGIDRFYFGRIGTGILKLITFGGFGIWTLVDWFCITVGATKDKQGRTLKGYDEYHKVIQPISLVIFIVGLVFGILNAIHNNPNINTASSQQKTVSGGLIEEKMELPRLSFNYPKTWKVTSEGIGSTADGHPTQDFEIVAPDGMGLGFHAQDSSAFANNANEINNTSVVAEVLSSNSVGSGVVTSNGSVTKPYGDITVSRGALKAGDTINQGYEDMSTNPSIQGLYITVYGGYTNGFATLTEFNNQSAVKQATQILKSMKYY